MTGSRLVVVGASVAGLRAVEAAREAGFRGAITLVGAEPYAPYDRPELSKTFLTATPEPSPRVYRDHSELAGRLGVELLLGTPATRLDPGARKLEAGGGLIAYDRLVIATGARARTLPEGRRLGGVHTLRTLDDARALRRDLVRARQVVVIGAGFVGAEVASSARRRGCAVTIVEREPVPLAAAFGARFGDVWRRLHERNGCDLRCGVSVTGLRGAGRVESVLLSDGTALDADLVVAGVGATPETGWLDGSGLEVDDGVLCDETLATRADGVYAAGDVARWRNPLYGRHMRVEHWTAAAEQGAAAGRNAVTAGPGTPCAIVPYLWSDWHGVRIQFAGVAGGDEIEVIGDLGAPRFVALHRSGDLLTGVLGVDSRAQVAAYRSLLRRGATWREALAARRRVAP